MLTHVVVGALSGFLVQANGGNPALENGQAQVTQTEPTFAAPAGTSFQFLGKTWCFGQLNSQARCDIRVPLAQVVASSKEVPSKAPEKPISWHFEVWDRTVCIGEIPPGTSCDFRFPRAERAPDAALVST